MFTGLIEQVGRVRGVVPVIEREALERAEGLRLEIDATLASDLSIGDSIATSGVCLTVTALGDGWFAADVSPETLRVTALGRLGTASPVNLERPLRADARLGGHFVQGHVDGVGSIARIAPEGAFRRVIIDYPPGLAPYFVPKGSVAVDGISLTVASLRDNSFDVQVVPHTWAQTTLGEAREGDAVNLECDLIGKYIVRLAEVSVSGRQSGRFREEAPTR